ncbi:MAG TPA: hypothetical protein VGN18_17480 [Jatrophihabitans sp.]|uniref:hypothetical protein n=1 Tax=Jatrophihabitans sp. TaxID=1932789 RepID=UPI002DFE29DE|nr:hypothetical protein [Jatrophihabitans sp.]
MHPGEREQTGGVPAATDRPGQAPAGQPGPSWNAPAGGYPTPVATPLPPGPAVRRARTGQVIVVAFVVELVITALVGNTAIAKHLQHYVESHTSTFPGRFVYAVLNLSWRFTPLDSDTQHILLSQLAGLATLFVVTALIVLITARGPVRFGRVFVTIWMAVLTATVFAGVVRRVVVDGFGQRGVGRFTDAVFSPLSSFDIVLGLALGLVVGAVAGAVATSTQRVSGTAINPAVAGGPIPSYGSFDGPGNPPAPDAPAAEPDRTTVLPRHSRGSDDDGPPAGTASDQTTQLPRPPDERG